MSLLKTSYNIIAVVLFVLSITLAHIFSTDNYDWTKNTISDMGSQGYDKKIIMQFGFVIFGLTIMSGILLNGLNLRTLPIIMYGLCVALTGLFCTKPFFLVEEYDVTQAKFHSFFAQLAGITFTIGILVQSLYSTEKNEKVIHLFFFILIVGFSAAFGLINNYQVIIQRLLYLTSFIWLIWHFKT